MNVVRDRVAQRGGLHLTGSVVAGTGLAVWLTASRWPDLIAGAILAVVFLQSAWSILKQSRAELKAAA